MKRINFDDTTQFSLLEDKAIDGILDYDNFPPPEYKYFSRLAKLGYLNRHKNWSVKICEEKQAEYKKQYQLDKREYNRELTVYKNYQDNILKSGELIRKIYFAKSQAEILELSLRVIELLTNENGFVDRINKKIDEMYTLNKEEILSNERNIIQRQVR